MKLHRLYGQSLQNIRKRQLKITLESLKNVVLFFKILSNLTSYIVK